MKFFKLILISILLSNFIAGCSSNETQNNPNIIDPLATGSGMYQFQYEANGYSKTLRIFYFIPENKTSDTPIVFSFHGTERNASDYRNAMIQWATTKGFIVIAPEFSELNFPDGDGYNLGNVFEDGDQPNQNTLNPVSEWTFSIIEPIFNDFKTKTDNNTTKYHIFGHSAGAQFAHRLMLFLPNANVDKAVFSAAGWYTFPNDVTFPYGFQNSPLENANLTSFFNKNVQVQVGENDNNPNASGLRHNEFADAQGLHRLSRATNYFQFCEELAISNNNNFNWQFQIMENTGHDYVKASEFAANFIFN